MGINKNYKENFFVDLKVIEEEKYQRAKSLLQYYQQAAWRLADDINELDGRSRALWGEELRFAVEVLDQYDYHAAGSSFDKRLARDSLLRDMLELMQKALFKVKGFPVKGTIYYEILYHSYFTGKPYSENEFLDLLAVSKSTYYRYRKEAIKLFGFCLWEIVLPLYAQSSGESAAETAISQQHETCLGKSETKKAPAWY